MNEKDSNREFGELQAQTESMVKRLSDLHTQIDKVIEENSELKIENEHLRALLKQSKLSDDQELSMSKKNLEKLYNEGFHICTQFYGKRREKDSNCMFCTDIIYGER